MGKLKRSFVAGSFVLHTVIIALLVLGPVLLAKREEKVQVLDLIPSEIVDLERKKEQPGAVLIQLSRA